MRGSRRRKSIYHWRKQEKATDANIMQLLMPSVLGIIICLVCLAGMTWAWFTDTGEVSAAPLRSAQHKVQVEIEDANRTQKQSGGDGTYTLTENTPYKVTLTVVESTLNGGFSAVRVDGVTYCTERMQKGDSITFTVCSENDRITIDSGWQDFSSGSESEKILRDGTHIGKDTTSTKEDEGNSNDAAQSNNADKTADREKIYIEPSSCASFTGPALVSAAAEYLETKGLTDKMQNASHILWATGGSMVPDGEMKLYYERGK